MRRSAAAPRAPLSLSGGTRAKAGSMEAAVGLGLGLGLAIGVGCRMLDIPLPAPPRLVGALLVVAMTLGFLGADWLLR